MAVEDQILELVVYQLARRVVVALNLACHHFHFLVHLVLWIGAVQHNVRKDVDGAGQMLFQAGAVVHGLFLARKGVQVSAYGFHAVDDVPCLAAMGPLEAEVFGKVCHAAFCVQLVTGSGIYRQSAVDNFGGPGGADNAHSAGKGMGIMV